MVKSMEIGIIEILMIFITIFIALGASFILPDKRAILKGEAPKYTNGKKNAVYSIGALVFIMTLIYIILTINNSGTIHLLAAINGIFFAMIGVGLMLVNRSIVNAQKNLSIGGMPVAPTAGMSVPVDVVGTGLEQNVQTSQSAPQEIKVHVRKPVEPGQTQPSGPAGNVMKVACPKCNGVISIDRSQPVSTIQCPMCGFEGNLG
jgi:ribosomal protein S27E